MAATLYMNFFLLELIELIIINNKKEQYLNNIIIILIKYIPINYNKNPYKMFLFRHITYIYIYTVHIFQLFRST